MSTTVGTGAAPGLRARGLRADAGRAALVGAVAVAGMVGFLLGGSGAGSDLLVLMRFMAGVKGAMALGAVALLWWRMAAPVERGTAAAYVVAASVMAAGPGLIWDMQHVALGATAVHGGLSALMVVAWVDRAGWNGVLRETLVRRRVRLT